MKILFAGNPEITIPTLNALKQSSYGIAGLLCKTDVKTGRNQLLTPTPSKVWAVANNVPIYEVEKIDDDFISKIANEKFDLMICFAFGKIFREKFLNVFPMGAVNIHPSLLPKWRGPSPISAAIFNGDSETGISIQTMALQMDAGDIISQIKFNLNGTETTASLTHYVAEQSANIIIDAIDKIASKQNNFIKQNDADATFCRMITKEDGFLDFTNSAVYIDRQIRTYASEITCYAMWEGKPIFIHEATISLQKGLAEEAGKVLCYDKNEGILIQTGDGILALKKLQLPAKKILSYKDFMNGAKTFVGSVLTKGV